MDWDLIIKLIPIVMTIGLGIFTFFATRRKDVDALFKTGTDRMDRHEARLARLELTVKAMPSKDDTHRLELMLAEMSGDMKAMLAEMGGMSASLSRTEDIVSRHEDHLRERS